MVFNIESFHTCDMTFLVTLLNMRSFRKHLDGIVFDKELFRNDIFCLKKIQFLPSDEMSLIKSQFYFNKN